MQVNGASVYSKLKWESGVHRVQRVPATESMGRIHTSTATVAIMPEVATHSVCLTAYRCIGAESERKHVRVQGAAEGTKHPAS